MRAMALSAGGPPASPSLSAHPPRRPLNRILVAQRITHPQALTGFIVAAQHVAACYLLIHRWHWGYLGAAAASVWSNLLSVSLLAACVAAAGKGGDVWGRPSADALRGWRTFSGLAYASAAMKCVESWSFRWVGGGRGLQLSGGPARGGRDSAAALSPNAAPAAAHPPCSLMNVLAGFLPGAAQSGAGGITWCGCGHVPLRCPACMRNGKRRPHSRTAPPSFSLPCSCSYIGSV